MNWIAISVRMLSALLAAVPWLAAAECPVPPTQLLPENYKQIWHGDLSKGLAGWGEVKFQFGIQNMRFINPPKAESILQVVYPQGSFDPATALAGRAPMGGAQFTAAPVLSTMRSSRGALLQYKVKFQEGFDFVLGGKLPGLYGGIPRSGGVIPTGLDGYSVRVVWHKDGYGAIYAYLPTSKVWGTLLGDKSWRFRPGQSYDLALFVAPNTPGKEDGAIYFWVDSSLRVSETGLRFRDTNNFNIDGIMFSTFFGGNTPDWASKTDTSIDFSDFRLSIVNPAQCGKL